MTKTIVCRALFASKSATRALNRCSSTPFQTQTACYKAQGSFSAFSSFTTHLAQTKTKEVCKDTATAAMAPSAVQNGDVISQNNEFDSANPGTPLPTPPCQAAPFLCPCLTCPVPF